MCGRGLCYVYHVALDVCTLDSPKPELIVFVHFYCRSERPDCWGWVNQGFVNILGCLLEPSTGPLTAFDISSSTTSSSSSCVSDNLSVGFSYYGRDRAGFMVDAEAQVSEEFRLCRLSEVRLT